MITGETIAKTKELYSILDEKEKEVSKLLLDAKDKHGEDTVERNGKKVKEIDLWEEVRYAVKDNSAWEILESRHPKVFEAQKEYEAALKDVQDFTNKELGIDYRKVTVKDIIELAEGIIDHKLNEVQGKKK